MELLVRKLATIELTRRFIELSNGIKMENCRRGCVMSDHDRSFSTFPVLHWQHVARRRAVTLSRCFSRVGSAGQNINRLVRCFER